MASPRNKDFVGSTGFDRVLKLGLAALLLLAITHSRLEAMVQFLPSGGLGALAVAAMDPQS